MTWGMNVRFQFRGYRLPFRAPVRTAHGAWAEREGLIVRVEDASEGGSGAVGWGEAAPIPWFGTETAEAAEAAARGLEEYADTAALLAGVPPGMPCLRRAVADAINELDAKVRTGDGGAGAAEGTVAKARAYLPVAALLPAGRAVLAEIAPKADAGFRVFKWKVGVGDAADELALLDDVCAALPAGGKLRLDANGAWDRRKAERWLERCADRPVEYVEQPCFAGAEATARERGRCDDVLLGLAGDFPTPLALDESVVGDGDVTRWIGLGWPGVYVVKTALLGDADGALAALAKARAAVVFSSALETAVGARAALRRALAWRPEEPAARALGFGVWPLFADRRCDGPYAAAFVRTEDVARLDAEAVWNAIS
jgi:O-succinylbenzoate synthase